MNKEERIFEILDSMSKYTQDRAVLILLAEILVQLELLNDKD